MDNKNNVWKNVFIHLCIWLVYITYEGSILLFTSNLQFNYFETGLNFLLYAFLFYCNSEILLPGLQRRRNYFLYLLQLVLLLAVYSGLRYGLNLYLLPGLNRPMLHPPSTKMMFWAQTQWRGGYFLMLSFGYWFARNSVQTEKRRREQAQHLQLVERNLLETEMAFLKSQINPHFLFNALNFLYAQVYPISEGSAQGILILSNIMRYALQAPGANGKVMLEDEVHYLNNYITINQLRFSNRLQIVFTCSGSPQFLMILPLLLITFVENCFKHGELLDPQNPLRITLDVVDNQLRFSTWNKKRDGPKEQTSGIGLANTAQRLALHYPNRHTLHVTNGADYYACSFTLDL
ncbi:sensor histidine kinase [Hymenobacter persicinus]|uniref:Signal transduction histidine kinase internal region domain-containing protein n=1 Tax=Hymenobacter persicinus TaxID=2025506 RepID=A0A4Q5LCK5_9BACT|nr:histidine kinase [Hymenobacter persicinus]RYU77920.1 hypothetical protein EWM57_16040 [Hymenobacter persicinus]